MIALSGYDAGLLTLAAVNTMTGIYVWLGLREREAR
jgi:hypothetical protein